MGSEPHLRASKRDLAKIVVDHLMGYNPENMSTSWFLSWLAAKLGIEDSDALDFDPFDDDIIFD